MNHAIVLSLSEIIVLRMFSLGIIPVNSGANFGILPTGTATFSMEELQKVDWILRF